MKFWDIFWNSAFSSFVLFIQFFAWMGPNLPIFFIFSKLFPIKLQYNPPIHRVYNHSCVSSRNWNWLRRLY